MPQEINETEFSNYVRMFKTYDQDGSGTIDVFELSEVMRCLGVTLTQEQLMDLMRTVDVDASGEIEFNEFLLLMVQHKESQAFRILQKSPENIEHVNRAMSSKMILPDARWRWLYDLAIFYGVVYYVSMVVYAFASKTPCNDDSVDCYPTQTMWPLELMISALFIADVVLNFRTAYISSVLLVEDPDQICMHYLTTTFIPDFIAALPLDLAVGYATGSTSMYLGFYALRVLKAFRLPFLFGNTHRGSMDGAYVTFYFKFIPMMKQVVQMFFTIHLLTCIWLRVQGSRSTYVQGLYLVLYTITTVGYGDIYPTTDAERLYTCFLFVAGLVLNAFVVGKMAATLQKGDIKSERKARMTETLAVLQHFEIPVVLQNEILAFQHHVLEHDLSSSYSEVVASLPSSMQDSLGLYIRVKFIMLVSFFAGVREEVRVALAQSLKNIVVAPEEFIIVKGEKGNEMFFVGHGFADVIAQTGQWICTVKKGHVIGEIALLIDCDRTASVKALTYCDLFRLDKADFWSIVKRFPDFAEQIRGEIKNREAKLLPSRKKSTSADELQENGPSRSQSDFDGTDLHTSGRTDDNDDALYRLSNQGLQELAEQDEAMRALDAGVQELVGMGGAAPLSCWRDGAFLHRYLRLPDGTVSVTVRKGEYGPESMNEQTNKLIPPGPEEGQQITPQTRTLTIRGRELKVVNKPHLGGEVHETDEIDEESKLNSISSFRNKETMPTQTMPTQTMPTRPMLRPAVSTGILNYTPARATPGQSGQGGQSGQNSGNQQHTTNTGGPPANQWRGVRTVSIHSDEKNEGIHKGPRGSPAIDTTALQQCSPPTTPVVAMPELSDEDTSPARESPTRVRVRARITRGSRYPRRRPPRGDFMRWAHTRITRTDKNVEKLLQGMVTASQVLERIEQAQGDSARRTRASMEPEQTRRVSMAASVVSRLSDSSTASFSQMRRGSASVMNPVRTHAAVPPRGSVVPRGSIHGNRSIVRGAGRVQVGLRARVPLRNDRGNARTEDYGMPGYIGETPTRESPNFPGRTRPGALHGLTQGEQEFMCASGILQQELSEQSLSSLN